MFARLLGPLLIVLLLGATLLLRGLNHTRADAILAGEARARHVVSALHHAAREYLARGEAHPGLAALAARTPELGLEPVPAERVPPSSQAREFVRDAHYVYGLVPTTARDEQGTTVHGYILRAWPRAYGVTGDLEFQLGADGTLHVGQNRLGRSGLIHGFPPRFPDPDLSSGEGAHYWWTEPLAAP